MVEIMAIQQNIDKRMKKRKNEDSQETSGTILNAPTFALLRPRKRKERKDLRKYWKK